MLDIYSFIWEIGNTKYLCRVGVIFSALVNFKLYTEIQIILAIEYGFGFIAVVMDYIIFISPLVAVGAIRCIVIVKVVGIFCMKYAPAVLTSGIMGIIATGAQRKHIASLVILSPYPGAAVSAYFSLVQKTVPAHNFSFKFYHLIFFKFFSAKVAFHNYNFSFQYSSANSIV